MPSLISLQGERRGRPPARRLLGRVSRSAPSRPILLLLPSLSLMAFVTAGKSRHEGCDRCSLQRDFKCPRARGCSCNPRFPAHDPQMTREGDGCIVSFDLSVQIEKVLAFPQSETLPSKTNILPHQESNFLSKQFSLNISKQPRVSIDLNCYKREKNEALSLQRSCLPTN